MSNYDELIERLERYSYKGSRSDEQGSLIGELVDDMQEAAQALRDLHRAYRPPDMVDYNKAMARIEELEAENTAMLDVVTAAKSSLLRRHMRGEIYAGYAVDKLDDALAKLEEGEL